MWETVSSWFMAAPHERALLILAVANTIVQKTPWKGDDDALKLVQDIVKAAIGRAK
jgi:hypothetical protein